MHTKGSQTFLPQQHRLALLTSRQAHHASTLPSGGHVPPSAKRQAPLMLLFQQVSSCGTTLIAKRHTLQFSIGFVVSPGGQTPPLGATQVLAQYWFYLSTQKKVKSILLL